MIGNNTFIAGTRDGTVSAWFRAPAGADGDLAMVRASEFESQGSPVTAIAASTRDRTFATAGSDGHVLLRHQTSGRTLASLPGLFLTGAGFRAIGVPDCITDGRETAAKAAAFVEEGL